jgi:hypothetical protein
VGGFVDQGDEFWGSYYLGGAGLGQDGGAGFLGVFEVGVDDPPVIVGREHGGGGAEAAEGVVADF